MGSSFADSALKALRTELASVTPDVDIRASLIRRHEELAQETTRRISLFQSANSKLEEMLEILTTLENEREERIQKLLEHPVLASALELRSLTLKLETLLDTFKILQKRVIGMGNAITQWHKQQADEVHKLSKEVERRYGPNPHNRLQIPQDPQFNL